MNETKGHVTIPLATYNEMRDRIKELEQEVRDRDYKTERISEALMTMRLTPDILEAIDLNSVVIHVSHDIDGLFHGANRVRIEFMVPRNKKVI